MLIKTTDEDAQEYVKKLREEIRQGIDAVFEAQNSRRLADYLLSIIKISEEDGIFSDMVLQHLKRTLKEISEGTFVENLKAFEKENPYDG